MKIEMFEDILAWKKGKLLAESIYRLFMNSRDYSCRDQKQQANISILNNIAEGYERKGNKDLMNFLTF